MKLSRSFPILLAAASPLLGVYAPIPDIEKGLPLIIDLEGGVIYDSNIFGLDSDEQDSFVYTVAPRVRLNSSLTPQSFLTAAYRLESLYFSDRPGDDTLFNHSLFGRLSHSFSERASLRIDGNLLFIESPRSALNIGDPLLEEELQQDQSFVSNQLSLALPYQLSQRLRVEPGAGAYFVNFEQAALARVLDYVEYNGYLEGAYQLSRTTQFATEIRFKSIEYDFADEVKGSETFYYLVGLDYALEEVTSVSVRTGLEDRNRNGADGLTRFYGQLAFHHYFTRNSFVNLAAEYAVQEVQATQSFYDKSGPSFIVNVQYDPSGAGQFYFTGNLIYSRFTLHARPEFVAGNVMDDELRAGLAAVWTYRNRWSLIASYDFDFTDSELDIRDEERHRIGVSLRYTFGLFD